MRARFVQPVGLQAAASLRRIAGVRLLTARTTLQPLGPADVDAVHAIWTHADVRRYLCDDRVVSLQQSRDWLTTSARNFDTRGFGLWGVRVEGGAMAGVVGCQRWPSSDEPELMYALLPGWWGQGLATETTQAVLAHVFERLGHPLAVAATDPPNQASIRVLDRLGMVFAERVILHERETLVYRLSRERWRRLHGLVRSPAP